MIRRIVILLAILAAIAVIPSRTQAASPATYHAYLPLVVNGAALPAATQHAPAQSTPTPTPTVTSAATPAAFCSGFNDEPLTVAAGKPAALTFYDLVPGQWVDFFLSLTPSNSPIAFTVVDGLGDVLGSGTATGATPTLEIRPGHLDNYSVDLTTRATDTIAVAAWYRTCTPDANLLP